jgi:uncharacterized membrane protein
VARTYLVLKALKLAGYEIKEVDLVVEKWKIRRRERKGSMDENRINPIWISCRICG